MAEESRQIKTGDRVMLYPRNGFRKPVYGVVGEKFFGNSNWVWIVQPEDGGFPFYLYESEINSLREENK